MVMVNWVVQKVWGERKSERERKTKISTYDKKKLIILILIFFRQKQNNGGPLLH